MTGAPHIPSHGYRAAVKLIQIAAEIADVHGLDRDDAFGCGPPVFPLLCIAIEALDGVGGSITAGNVT